MLETGNYTVNDPLIREIDKKIAALHWYKYFYFDINFV